MDSQFERTQAVCPIHDYMAALCALRLAKQECGASFVTGMNVLVTDGFSPVGQAVIALASMEGANAYCCADESNHSYLSSLGAKCFVVNPRAWLPTFAGTFDVVIDNSCVDAYSSSRAALNEGGSLVCLAPVYSTSINESNCGCGLIVVRLTEAWAETKAKYMMSQTSYLNMDNIYLENSTRYKQDLRYLMFMKEKGWIKPKVAGEVTLDELSDAQ